MTVMTFCSDPAEWQTIWWRFPIQAKAKSQPKSTSTTNLTCRSKILIESKTNKSMGKWMASPPHRKGAKAFLWTIPIRMCNPNENVIAIFLRIETNKNLNGSKYIALWCISSVQWATQRSQIENKTTRTRREKENYFVGRTVKPLTSDYFIQSHKYENKNAKGPHRKS